MTNTATSHYNSDYFNWQKNIGAFGGWANKYKYQKHINPHHTVIDFGCGGGFLLANLNCKRKIGIEPNASASSSILGFGIEHFDSPKTALKTLGFECADTIISSHALEHTPNPLQELKDLYPLLKKGGSIHFFVPLDTFRYSYDDKDFNKHLFSWSPQNLGNLFTEAGFPVDYSKPYIHKWPPYYTTLAKLGWPIFNFICKVWGRIDNKWYQVQIRALKD